MRDDRVLFASSAGVANKFTTVEVKAEVLQLDSALHQLAGQEARPTLDRGESGREGLDAGQRAAADRIAAGGGLTVIEGFAGAGKSTMLRAAAEDLRFSGHDVLGCVPSGKAAGGLEQSAVIDSATLARTLMDLERGDLRLTERSVIVMDEAGMARNDDLGKLAQHVAAAGGRLVLVGDERQLGAVGRGGGFAEAREIVQGQGTVARLDEIHRQQVGWQQDASKAFGEGRAAQAIQSYIDHGRVEWAASRGTARDMLVSDYVRELDQGRGANKMLALAHENRDVRTMNAEIRDAIQERGGLQDERTYQLEGESGKAQKIEVAVGDRVVFEKNNARSGEKNGEFGTVVKTDRHGFDIRMDGEHGRTMRVEDGGKHQMSHGYASTIHKSQGATVDKTFVLASKWMDSRLTYVSMSRQREDVKLYANHTEHKDAAHLKNSLSRDGGKEAFQSVRSASDGSQRQEKSQERRPGQEKEKSQHHGPAVPGNGDQRQIERQPVNSYILAAAMDQRKISTGLLEKPQAGQVQIGKEKAQTRAQDQGHGPRGAAGGEGQRKEPERDVERERQPVASYIAAVAMDQKKMETGLLPKDQARERQGQAGKDQPVGQQPAREAQAGDGKERAQSAQKDRDHGPRGAAGEQRETQQRQQSAPTQGQGKDQREVTFAGKQSKAQGKGESKSSSGSKGYGL